MTEDLEQQLRISLQFLEYNHGAALEHNNPERAQAYYDAIGLVEDALGCKWKPDADLMDNDLSRQFIDTSRTARESGWRDATMHETRRQNRTTTYRQEPLLDRQLPWRKA